VAPIKRILGNLFAFLWIAAVAANGLLFLYVEWRITRQDFFQLFNPLVHVEAVLTLFTMPLFWLLAATILVSYLLAHALVGDTDS